ncbi:DNA helicase [Trifolium repens]|nr:DNA helicase [Trifolium repens]
MLFSSRSGLVAFLGGGIVVLSEFLLGGVGEMVVVLACYLGVDEGVDMWFDKNSTGSSPRFRLMVTVCDVNRDASFIFYDGVAEKIAPAACTLLLSVLEGGSAYPSELDSSFGDPMLFKVKRNLGGGVGSSVSYEVLDVYSHLVLLDVYLNLRCPTHVFVHVADYLSCVEDDPKVDGCSPEVSHVSFVQSGDSVSSIVVADVGQEAGGYVSGSIHGDGSGEIPRPCKKRKIK